MPLVIGLGTGRCGTVSLAHLLNAQTNAKVTHEAEPLLPWRKDQARPDEVKTMRRMWQVADSREAYALKRDRFNERLESFSLVGDVANFWLPYMPEIKRDFPGVKVVGLIRDMESYVDSAMRKTGGEDGPNFWGGHGGWSFVFPLFPGVPKRRAIELYWGAYNARIRQEAGFIMRTEDLSDESAQDELFRFLGIRDHVHRFDRLNVGAHDYQAANGVRENRDGKPFELRLVGGEIVRTDG